MTHVDDDGFGSGELIEPQEGWFCLWAGDLSREELERYFEERRTDEGWTSDFREDLGRFYDHDRLVIGAVDDEPLPLVRLLADVGYDDDSASRLVVSVKAHAPPTELFHSVAVLEQAKATPFMSRAEFAGGRMRFIGSWQGD